MTKFLGSAVWSRHIVRTALSALALLPVAQATNAFGQQTPFFTPGNLVVVVEGCGVYGGTCTSVANGTGDGTGTSSVTGYGDNQAAPLTLFQYAPTATASATYVNSLVLPQTGSGANLPISGEYGSSSEGGLQLSGNGQYLTLGTYGINAAVFNANPATYGTASGIIALAQSGSLTGQSYTPVARLATLVDPYGNTNSSSAIFNIFNTNNPRSIYTFDGTTAYLSGQGAKNDVTSGVFFSPLGAINNAPTAITGLDTTSNTVSQDTRFVTAYNNTLYVSVDTKGGSNNARSFIGTLGNPPATSLFSNGAGPTQLVSQNLNGKSVSSAGKLTLTATITNNVNSALVGSSVNTSPAAYFFANASTLYVADTGNTKQTSGDSPLGDGGLQKWTNSQADGSGTWTLQYTLYKGLNLVANTSAAGSTGLYGLAGVVVGSNVYLYATNATIGDLDPTFIYGITDPLAATSTTYDSNNAFALLATAPSDSNFKGISFAPTLTAGSSTITTVPEGLKVTTAGTGCTPGTYVTPVTLVWTPGSACTLTTATTQTSGTTSYFLSRWQDGVASGSDSVVAPSASAVYTATFTNVATTPAVTVSPVSIVAGTATTTLTAKIAFSGAIVPAGNVTFTVNGTATNVGPTTCSGTASPLTCTATYTSSTLAAGTYPITATVAATNSSLAASGTAVLTVTGVPDFTFASTGSSSQTISKGGTANYTFSLTPVNGYPGAVTFSASGLPAGATASFTPTSVTSGTQTVTLAIKTAATSAANSMPGSPASRTALALAGLCLLPLGLRRKVRSGLMRNLALALVLGGSLVGLAGMMGCSTNPLPTGSVVTVTATSGSVSHSTTVTVVFQ